MLTYDELFLSDGTTTIDLLSLSTTTGAHLTAWRASASRYKDGGVWHNSAIAPGRRPVEHVWDAVQEEMTFAITGWTPDDRERYVSSVRNLLQAAWDYSEANLPQSSPVYLIRRVHGEEHTAREYSLVLGGFAEEDADYIGGNTEYNIVSFSDWALTIWREEHWRDVIPGDDPTCVLNSGYGETTQHVVFDRDEPTYVQIPAGANIDDLPNGGSITGEAWIRISGDMGAPAIHGILGKCSADGTTGGWLFYWSSTTGLVAEIITAAANGVIIAGLLAPGTVISDGDWHHVAFGFAAADTEPRLWIDGTEQSNNAQAKGAAASLDAAYDLYIGAIGTVGYWHGDIGWARVSDSVKYVAGFTPEPRCFLPDRTLANTMGQWIGGDVNEDTVDNQEGTAAYDGTLYNGTRDCDCLRGTIDANGDPEYLCVEDDITTFIRNSHIRAQPTHMFALDQPAAWGDDLVEDSAFNILPANSVAGDGFYVGITEEATMFYGPFFNLVFDIASTATYTGTWQYYSTAAGPGWDDLVVHDGTDGLENTGVVAVTWEIDTDDWAPLDVNGFVGYWVRFHLTVGHVTPPVQQNRPVYTTTWAFTELWGTDAEDAARPTLDNSVPGDVPALAEIQYIIAGEGKTTESAGMSSTAIDRVLFGLRSRSRGADFCAYLNAGDPSVVGAVGAQEPIGIIPEIAVTYGAEVEDDTREQGLHVLCADAGASSTFHSSQYWYISVPYAWQYYGRYRLFARAECTALNATSQLRGRVQMYAVYHTTPAYTFVDTNPEKLIDLGLVSIPGYDPISSADVPWGTIVISIQTSFGSAADTIKLYGIILLPADEKIVEITPPIPGAGGMYITPSTRFDIDSTSVLRTGSIRALTTDADGGVTGYMLPISAGPATFQANADQRIWMVAEQYEWVTPYWWSPQEFHAKLLLHRVARYQSTRGGR